MQQSSIVVVGSIIYDFRITADRLPCPGETLTGYGFGTSTGGKGANQAVAACRAGAPVHLIGRVGRDVFGGEVFRQFDQAGLNREFVICDPEEPTATCLIHVAKNGENDIIIAVGANGKVSCADVDSAREVIAQAGILLLQNEVPIPVSGYAIDLARQAGATVIYNPAPAKPLPDGLFAKIDFFTPNETETQFYTGLNPGRDLHSARQAADLLLAKGVAHVIITLGGQGALLAEGKSIPEAIRFANAAGAVCAMRAGAQSAIGNRQEIEALIQSRPEEKYRTGIDCPR